jgi:hypothetical protein
LKKPVISTTVQGPLRGAPGLGRGAERPFDRGTGRHPGAEPLDGRDAGMLGEYARGEQIRQLPIENKGGGK